jgi:hypothetical protein
MYYNIMLISKKFVYSNKLNIAIFIFILLFSLIHVAKPGLLYNKDGSFRQFGVGYRNKTVIPIWIIAIVLAIVSYLYVIYYLAYM